PPRYPDADGRQLLASDPDAGQPPDPAGPDAKIRGRADEHLLEIANVTVDVAAVGLQIDDRIAEDLAGTVVRDVAAPNGFVTMDTAGCEQAGRSQDMRPPPVAADAKGQYVRVLDEQEQIAHASRPTILDQRLLQRKRLVVRHDAQPPHVNRTLASDRVLRDLR